MEKKQTTTAKNNKKVFGNTALQLNDVDASCMIGGIVEKGFSDDPVFSPIAPPRPTLLHFPVARHRSEGPHWSPVNSKNGSEEGDRDSEDDDEAVMDFDLVKPYAKPVVRKSKKDMDFSKKVDLEVEESRLGRARETMRPSVRKNSSNSGSELKKSEVESVLDSNAMEIDVIQKPPAAAVDIREEQVPVSLESEIDAENRARLQGMSTEEIAEAQDEIMGRLDPALLQVLKRRGEEKLKKQRNSSLDNKDQKFSTSSHVATPQGPATSTLNHAWTDGIVPISGQAKGKLWNAWSERVEAVRGLRFSSDGTVVGYSLQQMPQVNLVERDYLRTEGDPGAAGYTIKEAVSLTRSLIAGQRDLALVLLSNVLNKALQNIHQNNVQITRQAANEVDSSFDWEAIWAYALGPEPELVLALRMCLDDNHKSVVRACAKVIYYVLSCDANENFFDVSEKLATMHTDTFTAPIFRSKPEIDVGFFHGGFWKYNAKPSNILSLDDDITEDEVEGKRTIQDDIVVAGQDFAAGLVRMGILPALCYLLESDPTAALEEYILSILIAIARHSPKCVNAIMICERLLQTVVSRFIAKDNIEIQPSKIKSVRLLMVLAQSDRKRCLEFIKNGNFQTLTWHLYQPTSLLDNWVKCGKEKCRLSAALMVEQLRFWKVCIQHGYCVSYFPEVFPYLCLWLNPPMLEKLLDNCVANEFASISREAYLVLEALVRRLPYLFAQNQLSEDSNDDTDFWSWSHVGPMVDIALKWIVWKNDPSICNLFDRKEGISGHLVSQDLSVTSLLWVYSAVMHMLSRVLERVITDDPVHLQESSILVPWLPEFVPKVGLEIIKNGFVGTESNAGCSFIEKLCNLRQQGDCETSMAAVCCLHGLLGIIISIDKLITLARAGVQTLPQNNTLSREEIILKDGILTGSLVELSGAKNTFMQSVASEWPLLQSIEKFGRGGPAPGVGVGWGASSGGFWSVTVLLAQADARILTDLIDTMKIVPDSDIHSEEEMMSIILAINSSLGVCVTAGPTDGTFVKKAMNSLLDVSVLKHLDVCIRRFLSSRGAKMYNWDDTEDNYLLLSRTLGTHFINRWLSVKKKPKDIDSKKTSDSRSLKKGQSSLDTIYEDMNTSGTTSQDLVAEWAHQRLPLPVYWILSPVSTLCESKTAGLTKSSKLQDLMQDPGDYLVVARAGLFFLLGIEALSSFLPAGIHSPIKSVPLVWKLHSLSVLLLVGMGVLEEEKSRVSYEALQDLYGNLLHQSRSCTLLSEPRNDNNLEILAFESEIHGTYSTFIETLVEQFSAVSYGDLIYGRQVAVYLHRCVEAPVRLATWNTLTNSRVLELLPPLESCFTDAEGYLEPVEDNSDILLAYVKSWTSGALDRAASRGSVAYTLVLHHLSAFIFELYTGDKLLLRNKLSRSLLQDFCSKQQHEAMMLDLIQYNKPSASQTIKQEDGAQTGIAITKRLELLVEACEGSSSLLTALERLKSSLAVMFD